MARKQRNKFDTEQPDADAEAFCAKVREWRTRRLDVTQKDFARMLSEVLPGRIVVQSRVAKWEMGEARPYGWHYVVLAAVTGTPLRYWLIPEITDPADPAAADTNPGPPPEPLSDDMKLIVDLANRLGPRVVLGKLLGVSVAEAMPPPAPPAADNPNGYGQHAAPPREALPAPKRKPGQS